ncbi:hypothetical protein Tco_0067800 [Tanacetum coccineum]
MLDRSSAIAQAFRMARDWCHSHSFVNVELRLLSERTSSRQYNAPTVAEVVAFIINYFGDGDPTRDIIVNTKDGQPKRISELHTSYMALQYPLLFPYGEDGYHDKIPYHRNTGIYFTQMMDAISAVFGRCIHCHRRTKANLDTKQSRHIVSRSVPQRLTWPWKKDCSAPYFYWRPKIYDAELPRRNGFMPSIWEPGPVHHIHVQPKVA